ncbi:MAG: hypothetical protein WC996_03400 [Peptostreptococcales bacterium]|jgi:uncharacterized membrane protein
MDSKMQDQSITKVNIQEKANSIYKKELRIAVIGAIVIICMGVGVLFMQPFPGLLNIKIWGFPFPYWYQVTFNWLGIAIVGYIISLLLKKNEEARAELEEREV